MYHAELHIRAVKTRAVATVPSLVSAHRLSLAGANGTHDVSTANRYCENVSQKK